MLLSIVTVIKSPAEGFGKTYASVLQEFGDSKDVEYLIKEWDATQEWSESDSDHSEGTLSIRRIKGQDRGIFDAMNQSISAAKGEWILFLNAGDWPAKGFGSRLCKALQEHRDCEYVYADGVTVDASDGREFLRQAPERLVIDDFLHHAAILHPCLIVKKSFLTEHPFDLSMDLAADYDLMVELVASGVTGHYLSVLAAFIVSGGLSEQARVRGKRQALSSLLSHSPSIGFKLRSYCAYLRFLIRHILIVYGVRPIKPLRLWAKYRTGGQPAGSYSSFNE